MNSCCVIGLGYVGLPIALELSKKFNTVGFDINLQRVSDLNKHIDSNNEFKKKDFLKKKIVFSNSLNDIAICNIFIICVPTPIYKNKNPDLTPLQKSFTLISKILKKQDIIILESTVYPGITNFYEKFLEKKTGFKSKKDFFIGYSPERINPGDKNNSLTKINKILSYYNLPKNKEVYLKNIYRCICKKVVTTKNIREAETAKVIENIQRDLNISFYNEVLKICDVLNLDFNETIRLATSKWNFIKFKPGLVGGHCLPVDPYYLSYISKQKGYNAKFLLAGRKTNESMKNFVLKKTLKIIKEKFLRFKNIKILVLGITYKYGIPDIRNSMNIKIFKILKKKFKNTDAHDPFSSIKYIKKLKKKKYNIILFLTDGYYFKKLFKKFNKNKKITLVNPFCYFN